MKLFRVKTRNYFLFVILFLVNYLLVNNAFASNLTYIEKYVDPSIVDGAEVAVFSPDNKFLYTGNTQGGSLSVFSVNSTDGSLSHVTTYREDHNNFHYITGITDIAISPDGLYLYAAVYDLSAIVVFSRNILSGELTQLSVLNGELNNEPLFDVKTVSISGDGKHLYAANGTGLLVYKRNISNGTLTRVAIYQNSEDFNNFHPNEVVADVSKIVLSDDDKFLYAAGYGLGSLAVFSRDSVTGELSYIEHHKDDVFDKVNGTYAINGARDIKISHDGTLLYVTAMFDDALSVFSRDNLTGKLSLLQDFRNVNGVDGAALLSVSQDDRFIYVTGINDNSLNVYERNLVTNLVTHVQTYKDEQNGITSLGGAYGITMSGNSNYLYVTAEKDDSVTIFSRNISNGLLSIDAVINRTDLTNGLYNSPTFMKLSPDGNHLYVVSPKDHTINVFSVDPSTKALTFIERYTNNENGLSTLVNPHYFDISPDGNHLYIPSYVEHMINMFERDPTTGLLTYIGKIGNEHGLYGVKNVKVSPDGTDVYAVTDYAAGDLSKYSHSIVQLRRDTVTGLLTVGQKIIYGTDPGGAYSPHDIEISNDNKDVYVSDLYGKGVIHFLRDLSTGVLTYINNHNGGGNPVDIVLTPDQRYMIELNDTTFLGVTYNTIVVYERNLSDGSLMEKYRYTNQADFPLLQGGFTAAVTHDNHYLYINSFLYKGILVFAILPDGQLHLVDSVFGDIHNIDGMLGSFSLTLTGDSDHLYHSSELSGTINHFSIDNTDLSLNIIRPVAPVYPELSYDYIAEVKNETSLQENNIVIKIPVPNNVSINSVSSSNASCSSDTEIVCNIFNLPFQNAVSIDINLTYASEGSYDFEGVVFSESRDVDWSNNSFTFIENVVLSEQPVAITDQVTGIEDTLVSIANVLANDYDPDGDILILLSSDTTSINGGNISLNGDNSFSYMPTADFYGLDSFNYTVSDGKGGRAIGTVEIAIENQNDNPVAVGENVSTTNTSEIIIYNVLINDTDVDGDLLSILTFDNNSMQNGVISSNGGDDFTYKPPSDFVGQDNFTYTITDSNGGQAIATVYIAVSDGQTNTTSNSGGGGGGCSYNPNPNAKVDPVFPILLIMAYLYLWRRRI